MLPRIAQDKIGISRGKYRDAKHRIPQDIPIGILGKIKTDISRHPSDYFNLAPHQRPSRRRISFFRRFMIFFSRREI